MNFKQIASDFVINTKPMDSNTKIEELALLLESVAANAELEVLEKYEIDDIEEATSKLNASIGKLNFHNSLKEVISQYE